MLASPAIKAKRGSPMIVQCTDCQMYFEDCYRSTICPHETFAANDGSNNFAHHPESHLSQIDPFKKEQKP
jgi:hypothetical protein